MSNSNEAPNANHEAQVAAWILFACWLLTFASFVILLLVPQSKWALKVDAILCICFAGILGFATIFCSSARHFIWICVVPLTGLSTVVKYCEAPNVHILRNYGQNLALVLMMSVLCAVYVTHFVFVVTKLCTQKFLPNAQVQFSPIVSIN